MTLSQLLEAYNESKKTPSNKDLVTPALKASLESQAFAQKRQAESDLMKGCGRIEGGISSQEVASLEQCLKLYREAELTLLELGIR